MSFQIDTVASQKSAAELMDEFASRTGLSSDRPPKRYLWTDAFAVCNLLTLAAQNQGSQYDSLALRLIDSVHEVLGRRQVDRGQGAWLAGVSEDLGRAHPTIGGLRIGKPLAERAANQPFDPNLEWDRDGQYFHYLTRWMYALDLTSRTTKQAHFNQWARELAMVAHRAFTYVTPMGTTRMVWKMSVDLSRTLVPSMGHHDCLDGYVTYNGLQATADGFSTSPRSPHLGKEIEVFATMIEGMDWTTDDSLGIGGLFVDALRIAQLRKRGRPIRNSVLQAVFSGAISGLREYVRRGEFRRPAESRLAFRELGLVIGLQAVPYLREMERAVLPRAELKIADAVLFVGDEIQQFWLDPAHRRVDSWVDHQDINDVMLATSLAPLGYLDLLTRVS